MRRNQFIDIFVASWLADHATKGPTMIYSVSTEQLEKDMPVEIAYRLANAAWTQYKALLEKLTGATIPDE